MQWWSGGDGVEIKVPEDDVEDLGEQGGQVVMAIGPGREEAAPRVQQQGPQLPGVAVGPVRVGESYQQVAQKLVDMRGVALPPPFSGEDEAWQDWRLRFQTAAALLDIGDVMNLAAALPREITEDELSVDNAWRGKVWYSLLVSLVGGRGLGIVRQVKEGHGLEACGGWRASTNRWSRRGSASCSQLCSNQCGMTRRLSWSNWWSGSARFASTRPCLRIT